MKYDEEVLERIGSVSGVSSYGVVVYQPHWQEEYTTIGLDTPDERRWDIDAEEARALAAVLIEAAAALEATQAKIAARRRQEEDEDA